ncbi:MAG: hypothetical protein HN601_05915 [Candidatus Marinimicrobia bacterium]|jgi:hypothetical protein|nr:hypothetical protein [Candidatus Neomarinimicrobiota bacterium]
MKQEDKNIEPIPSVLKHVLEMNPTFSKAKAIQEALAMEDRYNEANKERNAIRNIEYQKQWDRALQKENDHWALEMLTGDALGEYFNVLKD